MNKKKLILTSGAANIFEWYDYVLFGHFAPIIGANFFPDSDPKTSLLEAFLVFAIGYLMRPVGGIVFGMIGDKFGRRTALSSAMIVMAFPTAAIAFLPTYKDIGIAATILMVIIRMTQGFSMGGAVTGSMSFIIEHTEKKYRGLFGSIPMFCICIGILLGSVISYFTKFFLAEEAFYQWGWRTPFLIGIAVFFTGNYIKKHTLETPLFEESKYRGEVIRSPFKQAFTHHWRDMLISMGINATGSLLFYMEAIYLTSYMRINRGFSEVYIDNLTNFCYIIMAIFTLLTGWLSDKIGRRKIFVINLTAIIVFSPILLQILENGNYLTVILAQIIIAIMAASYIGPEPTLQAELYPTNLRNTCLSISYNTAASIFGGTAPYIIEYLVQNTGHLTSSIYYIIFCSLLSLVALYFYKDRSIADYKVIIDDE